MYNRKKLAFLLKVCMSLLMCSAACQWYILLFGGSGHGLLILSDMPTFAVVLNLKQLSWHAAIKPVFAL
jgi:hypothetical protein